MFGEEPGDDAVLQHAPERERVVALHAQHVVLGRVQDALPRRIGEQRQQRREPERERVHGPVRRRGGDLQQADLLEVGVEAVALGVQSHPGAAGDVLHAGGELILGVDEALQAIHWGCLYHALPRS